jgi:hypothetical protein
MAKKAIAFRQPKSTVDFYSLKHIKSVRAYALIYKGEMAGRIAANWSDNPAGSVCTAMVAVYLGPLKEMPFVTGKAGGYGYCKFSAAVDHALRSTMDLDTDLAGHGESTVIEWFERLGYKVAQVI